MKFGYGKCILIVLLKGNVMQRSFFPDQTWTKLYIYIPTLKNQVISRGFQNYHLKLNLIAIPCIHKNFSHLIQILATICL